MSDNDDDICTVFGILYDQLVTEDEEDENSNKIDLSKRYPTKLSLYTEKASRLRPKHIPIMDTSDVYISDQHGKSVGKLSEAWIEGKNVMGICTVFDKEAAKKVRNGDFKFFSAGWSNFFDKQGNAGDKKLHEIALTPLPVHQGCEIKCFASESGDAPTQIITPNKIKKQVYNNNSEGNKYTNDKKMESAENTAPAPVSESQENESMETEEISSFKPGSLLKKLAAQSKKTTTTSEGKKMEESAPAEEVEEDKNDVMTKKKYAQMIKKQQEELEKLKKEKEIMDAEAEKYRSKYSKAKEFLRQDKKQETDRLLTFSAHFLGVDEKDLDTAFQEHCVAFMSEPKYKDWNKVLSSFIKELDHATEALSEQEATIAQLTQENNRLLSQGSTPTASVTGQKRKEVNNFTSVFNTARKKPRNTITPKKSAPPTMQTGHNVSSEFTGGHQLTGGQTHSFTASQTSPATETKETAPISSTWTLESSNNAVFWGPNVQKLFRN